MDDKTHLPEVEDTPLGPIEMWPGTIDWSQMRGCLDEVADVFENGKWLSSQYAGYTTRVDPIGKKLIRRAQAEEMLREFKRYKVIGKVSVGIDEVPDFRTELIVLGVSQKCIDKVVRGIKCLGPEVCTSEVV